LRAPLAGHTTERAPQTPGCTSAYVLMGDRDRIHITGATAPVRALGGPSNARTGLPPCTSGCRLRGEGLSEGKTKVVGPPRRKNEGGAGQNFLKVTQYNLRKAKRRSNEGPAKENPGLRWLNCGDLARPPQRAHWHCPLCVFRRAKATEPPVLAAASRAPRHSIIKWCGRAGGAPTRAQNPPRPKQPKSPALG